MIRPINPVSNRSIVAKVQPVAKISPLARKEKVDSISSKTPQNRKPLMSLGNKARYLNILI
jgi:hypothetical protein